MVWCLPSYLADMFLKKIKDGTINPEKMIDMTSAQRREFLAEFMGEENARQSNALFESRLLLKNQKDAMVLWAKKTAGIQPEAKRSLLDRINKMSEKDILTPENEDDFLEDLAAHVLGTTVTMEEAGNITYLASKVSELKTKATKETNAPNDTFESIEDRMAYGKAVIDFRNYYSDLKTASEKMTIAEYIHHPLYLLDDTIHNILGLTKSMLSSLDNSAIGTQGMKTLLNDAANTILLKPTHQWWSNTWRTFPDMYQTWVGKEVEDINDAEIISRPNALNGLYKKHKVSLTPMEENYPQHLGGVPVIGRALKGFENAFTGFQKRNRADTFDVLVNMAKSVGKDPFSSDIEGFGKLANTLTSRGTLEVGRYNFEVIADFVNLVSFAGRFMKSNIDFLTFNQIHANMSPYARKMGAIQSLKGIAVIAGFLVLADALDPDSVEWDPTKTTFGGIKKGTIIYEPFKMFTSYVVLAARLITGRYTSIAGKTTKLNTGKYGQPTRKDVLVDFLSGKESPPLRILDDILKGENFKREKPTITGEITGVITPIPGQTAVEYYKNPYVEDADKILAMIAEFCGVRTTPIKYPPKKGTGKKIEIEKITIEED